jgi:ribosomal protein S18 acetylase RimI-like enzyme
MAWREIMQPHELVTRIDPSPSDADMAPLWRAAWNSEWHGGIAGILAHSLVHLGTYAGERLVGYVNVATDGGVHGFLLDPTVHPEFRRRGLGRSLVRQAADIARQRGAHWLHVDFEPHLEGFYRGCGFRPTRAGLLPLQ